jgi:sulfide:quinone oxidoreductase
MKQLIILGAGTGGSAMAHRLVRALDPATWHVTVIDQDDEHIYQPGLLFVPFGQSAPRDLVRSRAALLPPEAEFIVAPLDRVDADNNRVVFEDGHDLRYDVLVVATGTRTAPEELTGLTGPGWLEHSFDFYTLEGATALAHALERFQGGRVVVNIAEMPIKCPVAPLEFVLLADAFFTERGIREQVELVYVTPLDGAFTKPRASEVLGGLLEQRDIEVVADFNPASVDGELGTMTGYDGREVGFDLLVCVPPHRGADLITRSGLGDEAGFVPTNRHTLQSRAFTNIFALGDATDVPTSKAGSVAHFQSEVLIENILRFLRGEPLRPDFDGHANCYIETGFGKAMLLDFNYQTEPLPGRFPLPGLGPFTLLEESHANHWGKLGFRWVYWNLLVQGRDIPIDHRLAMAGKWS